MTELFRLNLAVPSTALLSVDNAGKLAFETSAWMHLNRYVNRVENLPEVLSGASVSTSEALATLQSEVERFGSPKGLRQLLIKHPDALAAEKPPSLLYASIVWLVQRLHESASYTIVALQSLLETLPSLPETADSGSAVREFLLDLGRKADDARNPIANVRTSLESFKSAIMAANNNLAEAYKTDAGLLQQKQERVGALRVQLEGVQKKIDELGFFSSKQKRTELEQELDNLQKELKDTTVQAEMLRTAAIAALEPILEDGAWLQAGLDDLLGFLDNERKVWTDLGSGLTQLAADASESQLGDLTFLKKALGFDESVQQWNAIDHAAKQFVVNALVDTSIR